jgi:hypothetical protein
MNASKAQVWPESLDNVSLRSFARSMTLQALSGP